MASFRTTGPRALVHSASGKRFLLAGAVLTVGASLIAGATYLGTRSRSVPVSTLSVRNQHGVSSDIFDWSDGLADPSLEEALTHLAETPLLPKEGVVGRPIRVVLIGDGQVAKAEVGLAVLYDSGVKLFIEPGREVAALPDYEALRAGPGRLAYKDGRAQPYSIQSINGRKTVVHESGEVVSKVHGDQKSPASVIFVQGTTQYTLIAGTDSVSLGTLVGAAQSMK